MKRDESIIARQRSGLAFPILELGIMVAVWLSLSGWMLSLLGHLDSGGYLVSVAVGLPALGLWLRMRRPDGCSPLRGWRRRARRPLPALFVLIFTLAALGGVLHHPNNYDALTYRLPQLLHWLDTHRWHWIRTSNPTFNVTAPGFGWLMAPLLALTHGDRGFFLPNVFAFALLPGLFFSVLRGCGVRGRVAWFWMWLLPTGYCFAMHAGGIGNDFLPGAYILTALAFAFRARRAGNVRDVWFSGLAAALATGVKAPVLPLALPWLVALLPVNRLLGKKPVGSLLVALVGIGVSFIPTAALNTRYTGDWSGDPDDYFKMRLDSPLYGAVANTLQIVVGNLAPPFCPFSGIANARFAEFKASAIGMTIRQHFPRFDLAWGELPAEEGSGIGLGLVILAVVSLAAAAIVRSPRRASKDYLGLAVGAASVIAAGAYLIKMGSEAAPRLFAPYYPLLLIPILRLAVNERLTRRRWWQATALVCGASVLPALVLTPARPLWPARQILAHLAEKHPDSALLRRSLLVYGVYADRHDYLAPLKKYIPSGVRTVGFVPTGNDLESSLWRPFGERRVVEILTPTKSDPAFQELHGSVVVTSRRGLEERFHLTVEEFVAAIGGRVIGEATFSIKAAIGPEPWCVIAVEENPDSIHSSRP